MRQAPVRAIVVGLDDSPHSEAALRWSLNNVVNADTDNVHLVYVVPHDTYMAEMSAMTSMTITSLEPPSHAPHAPHESLTPSPSTTTTRAIKTTLCLVKGADAKENLVLYAKEHHADIVVVGSRGRGVLTRMVMGSVSDYVMRNAPCPVIVVRDIDVGGTAAGASK
ncbi:hypothetical protein BC831DRAFT_425255 [Entophlyctis helioformis]|nr:hypothetical protein BC831DRAFT_425255 [Entophlyctis helioformis]